MLLDQIKLQADQKFSKVDSSDFANSTQYVDKMFDVADQLKDDCNAYFFFGSITYSVCESAQDYIDSKIKSLVNHLVTA